MNQESRREELYVLLGDLPDRRRPVRATTIDTREQAGYLLEVLVLDLNGEEEVPAYFARPLEAEDRTPCILYNHAHGGKYDIGKEELLEGRVQLQNPPYVDVLTKKGFSVLCIDAWLFGERKGRSESELFKQMLWNGQVLWGMMVYDGLRAFDYALSRPDVDNDRIGTLGLSMGSTMAWWLAALEPRIKVCVDICCLTDFQALIDARGLDSHGIYYYVPGLTKSFTTAQINALIAPRPHLSLAGNYDLTTPPAGLDRIDVELKRVYSKMGANQAWRLERYDVGHFESAHMRMQILDFLSDWL